MSVGAGFAQVGILLVLTVVVLPCCFFTLLALLDRFERSLAPTTERPAPAPAPAVTVTLAAAPAFEAAADDGVGGDLLTLTRGSTPSPAPTAAAV
jgi:hypothetical protein